MWTIKALFIKLKTDATNPVSSATVYRIFSFVFLQDKRKRDRKRDGLKQERDQKR